MPIEHSKRLQAEKLAIDLSADQTPSRAAEIKGMDDETLYQLLRAAGYEWDKSIKAWSIN